MLANREDTPVHADVAVPGSWPAGIARDTLSGDTVTAADRRIKVEMAPKSVRILVPAAAPDSR